MRFETTTHRGYGIAIRRVKSLSPAEKRARLQVTLEKFPEHSKEREELIVAAVARGAIDPPEWTTIVSNYQGRRAEVEVTNDALTILGVRFDVTAEGAQRIAGRKGLIVNVGKHWVLTNRITEKNNLAANYGWFMKGRRPIQTVGTRHDTAHTDYSQVLRLAKPMIRVDGREVDIRRVGRSPEL